MGLLWYRVNNIKISYKIYLTNLETALRNFARESSLVTKVENNFFVLKSVFVYTVFFTGHVNCTKIHRKEEISTAVNHLRNILFDFELCSGLKVDNISASGALNIVNNSLSLLDLADFLKQNSIHFRYNPEQFPGLSLKFSSKGATFLLFQSGKFVVVGTKGTLKIGRPSQKNRVEIYDQHGARKECVETFWDRFSGAFENMIQDFIDCLIEGRKPSLT